MILIHKNKESERGSKNPCPPGLQILNVAAEVSWRRPLDLRRRRRPDPEGLTQADELFGILFVMARPLNCAWESNCLIGVARASRWAA